MYNGSLSEEQTCRVVKKKWVDSDIDKTLSDVAGGISIRKAAKTHGMVEGTLR